MADSYNAMIESAQSSLVGYNQMREALRQKLGDHSSLEALTERLESLTGETLANLQSAMSAMNDGDADDQCRFGDLGDPRPGR